MLVTVPPSGPMVAVVVLGLGVALGCAGSWSVALVSGGCVSMDGCPPHALRTTELRSIKVRREYRILFMVTSFRAIGSGNGSVFRQ